MKKLKPKHKMLLLLICCIAMSAYALHSWSVTSPLKPGSYLVSILIHITIPMVIGWGLTYKKISK